MRHWSATLAIVLALGWGCTGVIEEPTGDRPPSVLPVDVVPGPSGLRTLTPSQYRSSVVDLLGIDATAVGQWTSSIAAARGGIAPATVREYHDEAHAAAAAVFADPAERDRLVGCTPTADSGDTCARTFIDRFGRHAFRRPLTTEESDRYVALAAEVGVALDDPNRGLEFAVAGMLQSPHFLYRAELGEAEPDSELRRFTSHEMAMRISYLVWGSTPDSALLDAADAGELDTADGVRDQVRRLLDDERAREGLRELFADVFGVDEVLTTDKDLTRYPFFTDTMRGALRDQFLMTAEGAVRGGDYRDLFTTRSTFMNDELAVLYGVAPTFGPDLVPYTFDDASPRSGVLTLAAFVAHHAYPAKTSPALRGLFVRKTLLCQDIPPPPADVVTVLPEPAPGELMTTRQLVEERHQTQEACASCHRFMDPIGLALENFDAVGQFRATQNDLPIDPSGELDGVPFDDASGLGAALAGHDQLAPCLMNTLHAYASGHTVFPGERSVIDAITDELVRSDYQLDEAIVSVATSDVFRFASDLEAP